MTVEWLKHRFLIPIVFTTKSFFVLEIFTFFYHAIEEGDNVIGGSTETAQHSIENNSRNIKAVFFKLGTSNVHHERNIMT